jgi:hypothetical protein
VLSGHSNLRNIIPESLSCRKQPAGRILLPALLTRPNGSCLSFEPPHLVPFRKMAESRWRAQIERVRQNDPTLTELM